MKRYFSTIFLSLCVVLLCAQPLQSYSDYIAVFAPTAVSQMEQYGIPASITLAQGLLESGAGKSDLTLRSNNHFGIKCTSDWTGKTTSHDDDALGECFRVYDDPADSYRDHSLFLKRTRYASLFELSKTDYRSWAHGLKRCGYATDPAYPTKLIKLIEDYDLAKYDKMKLSDVPQPTQEQKERYVASSKKKATLPLPLSKPIASTRGEQQNTTKKTSSNSSMGSVAVGATRKIQSVNKCKYIIARDGDTYASLAAEYNIAERRLRDFNEAGKLSQPRSGERVYLQSKRNRGAQPTHIVKQGETMRAVAQAEGIRLRKLYEYNTIPEGDQPVAGQTLKLKR